MKKLGKRKLKARAKLGQEGFMKKTTAKWRSANARKAALARWSRYTGMMEEINISI